MTPAIQNLPSELKNIKAEDIDWKAEVQQTLDETGWNLSQLATVLGLYVQLRGKSKLVSPHIYSWLRGKHKPKLYLLYALRYLRAHYGQAPAPGTTPAPTPKE